MDTIIGKDSMSYMAMFDRRGLIKVVQFIHVQINSSISGVKDACVEVI